MEELMEMVRNRARSDVLRLMSNEEKAAKVYEQIKNLPDEQLDRMGSFADIPEHQLPVYRAMMRGEENEFLTKMSEFNGVLLSGDVILVTGKKFRSKALVAAQLPFYTKARASHVAMVHADFICIDAMPGEGVNNRTIAEVLDDVEDNWRVIRFNAVTDENREDMLKRCAFYLQQPYSIKPKKGAGKKFSYCSELVSKVYQDCKVRCIKIPTGKLINPCHFDRLADKGEVCKDITETVRPFLEFLKEYKAMLSVTGGLFIKGLQLNRHRDKERKNFLSNMQALAKGGDLTHESLVKMTKDIEAIQEKMNFRFWDSPPNIKE